MVSIAFVILTLDYQNLQAQSSKNNNKPKIENKMTVEQNKQVVIRFNNEFFEKGNTDIIKELFAENFVNHSAPPNSPTRRRSNGEICYGFTSWVFRYFSANSRDFW